MRRVKAAWTRSCAGMSFLIVAAVAGHSLASEPTTAQCIAANDIAVSALVDHRLRQARDQNLVCSALSCPDVVRATCLKRAADVATAIPTIVFVAVDESAHELLAVRVSMDGEVLVNQLDGTGVAVDPGRHVFTFVTEGRARVEVPLLVVEGEKDRKVTVRLGQSVSGLQAAAPSPFPTQSASSQSTAFVADTAAANAHHADTRHMAGFAVGGVGILGLAAGATLGVLAILKAHTARNECAPSPGSCSFNTNPVATSDMSDARTFANGSTVLFVAGGTLAAVGFTLVLWPLAKGKSSQPHVESTVGAQGAGLTMSGTF
jgi:hypothetical protein